MAVLAVVDQVDAGLLLAADYAGGKIRADLAFTYAVPAARRDGHAVALGVDWGLTTLLSAGAARLDAGGTITALGSGAQYRAAGVLARQHRLRRHGEQLHAKASHYDRLIAGDEAHPLNAKRVILAEEIRQVSERRSNLNDALARSAARWAVDQAVAAGASVIYLEDLRSMEAKGMGRTLNTRLSQTVRGQIAAWIRHLAAETGIAVVTVPARGTSARCPRCLAPLRHSAAPDRPGRRGQLPRAAHRNQDVTTISTPARRHQPRGGSARRRVQPPRHPAPVGTGSGRATPAHSRSLS